MSVDRVPYNYTYLLIAVWVLGMCSIALYEGPTLAVQTTAGSLAVFAFLRAVLRPGVMPSVRGRVFDVIMLLVGAAALFSLVSVADTPLPM